MKNPLQSIHLRIQNPVSGELSGIHLSYQTFGQPLHAAPIVLVNHALTGNSNVSGENGWWNSLIGKDKAINTNQFTVLCFNIPGNGFNGDLNVQYQNFKTKDIAEIFLAGLAYLKIFKLEILIGGSLGGAIGWEMLAVKNNLTKMFFPVACDYKTSDWLHAQCLVQKFLLSQKDEPLEKARMHAMLCYRTPESLNHRFKSELHPEKNILKSHDWLHFHGRTLSERFHISAYLLMNHLLMNIHTDLEQMKKIEADIHLIAVDSDLFFLALEMLHCYEVLKKTKTNTFYHEIKSKHGHDAFLMEYDQLHVILKSILHEK